VIRITTTISYDGRRRHIMLTRGSDELPWALQWANPTQHGYSLEPAIAMYRTRREATEAKRKIMRGES